MTTKIPKRNSANKESAEELVASIDDLLNEILLRLPVRFLFNFKLVLKRWHSLISNTNFVQRWRNPNLNLAVGMLLRSKGYNSFEYIRFFSKDSNLTKKIQVASDFMIKQSCNGLLLCQTHIKRDYYVYNLTTNQCSHPLPKLNGVHLRSLTLAFDPAKSLDPYRVVCVHYKYTSGICHRKDIRFQISVYDPKTSAWRSSGVDPFTAEVDFGKGVYWNNAIHWISSLAGDSLYFNVRGEVLNRMANPPKDVSSSYGIRKYYLWESCDHLHYIPNHESGMEFSVYEMKRDYSEWFVKYHIDLSSANPWTIGDDLGTTHWYSYFCLLSIVTGDHDASFLFFWIKENVI